MKLVRDIEQIHNSIDCVHRRVRRILNFWNRINKTRFYASNSPKCIEPGVYDIEIFYEGIEGMIYLLRVDIKGIVGNIRNMPSPSVLYKNAKARARRDDTNFYTVHVIKPTEHTEPTKQTEKRSYRKSEHEQTLDEISRQANVARDVARDSRRSSWY